MCKITLVQRPYQTMNIIINREKSNLCFIFSLKNINEFVLESPPWKTSAVESPAAKKTKEDSSKKAFSK